MTSVRNWYPSRWGKDDETGALNFVTSKEVIMAARLVKTGIVYNFGLDPSRVRAPQGIHSGRRLAH